MVYKLAGSLVMILAMFSTSVIAGDVTLYGGFQRPGKLSFSEAATIVQNDSGSVFGLRYSQGQSIGFEYGFGFSPNFLDRDQNSFTSQINLNLGFPIEKVIPYGTIGVGFIRTWGTPENPNRRIGTEVAINYGGGLKFRNLAGPLGLRFDIRGYAIPGVEIRGFSLQDTLHILEGSAGLLFSW